MVDILTEGPHAGEHLISEASGTRSRNNGVLATGVVLLAGAVLGLIAKAGASAVAWGANVGDGVMGAITVGVGSVAGIYRLTFIEPGVNAGVFTVEDPNGVEVGVGTVAVAFSAGGLAFTLADGATDFAVGDGFDITVAAGSGKYTEYDPANTDGSEVAAAVLWEGADATAADQSIVVHARDCEVQSGLLNWFTGATADQKTAGEADLAASGIIAR